MAFGKKTVLPLSHAEQLRNHLSVFTETLNNLRELEEVISEELSEAAAKCHQLNQDLTDTRDAIARVRKVTG